MAKYKIVSTGSPIAMVKDTETGTYIPNSIGNLDWRLYLKWVEEGNTPDPFQEPTLSIEEQIENITVEIDGILLTGNEIAQQRMARAILTMDDVETIMWQTNSGSPAVVNLTKDQLKRALRAAGEAQVALWFV